ncbi:MAG: S8 family serine peptidase, partial [Acidobacteria bacterium]|nr:S8 family serine peptidase [Acidobacteriota bacterium]
MPWQGESVGVTNWIFPAYSTVRAHSGSRSAYMTGWDNWAQTPLGPPYPDGVDTILKTPPLNLAGYEEVYVEYWFWAEYEHPAGCAGQSPALCDYGKGYAYDPATQSLSGGFIAVPFTGQLWGDATAQNGWRRVLVRVPPPLLENGVEFRFEFLSDSSVNATGLFIDDVRIVGTANVDTEPIGNDPYGARQYELKNAGQIAGLGNDDNDLNVVEAWNEVSVSSGVVVAVIDDGVELAHPDLNLVTGYDGDTGAVGGAPRDADSNHGTACAGNVGAIRDNGIGISGTAPGVEIMPVHNGGTEATLANAIAVAVSHGASVLSNSWGWVGAPNSAITTAFQNALASGRAVLIAAGNGPDRPPWSYETAFPCNLTAQMDVVCVGASSPTDEHKSASSSDGLTSWGSSYIGAG